MSWRPVVRTKAPRRLKKRQHAHALWLSRVMFGLMSAKLERMAEFNRKAWGLLREASGLEP